MCRTSGHKLLIAVLRKTFPPAGWSVAYLTKGYFLYIIPNHENRDLMRARCKTNSCVAFVR